MNDISPQVHALMFLLSFGKGILFLIVLWWLSTSVMPWTIELAHILTSA